MTTRTERRATPRAGKEPRHRAREAAVQMLYQWEVGRASLDEVLETFWMHDDTQVSALSEEHRGFAQKLAAGVVGTVGNLDPVIAESAEHWRIERLHGVRELREPDGGP